MSQTTLDSDGNFATEAFQQQVRKFLNTTDVALKARELCRLDAYVEYLAQVEDPNDPAMMELWGSGLFEETIDILSTPMMDDMWGHVKLYRITLMILNDILLSPWIHNSQARALMKSRAAVILDEQGFVYGLPMGEESKPKFRELLLGLFGDLLTEFADDDLGDKLDGSVLLGLAFDYYFGITPPSQDDESAIGANIILLKYSRESFGGEPAPYLHDVLVQHGEKHIADRYIEIAENAGETQLLSSHSSWELLARLISAKPLQMRLLEDAKVHMSVMTNTWKEAYEDPDLSPKIARRVLIIITQMITEIEAPLRSSFVQDLVQTDLILLFGRALLAEQDIGHIRGIVKTLVTYCQLRSHAKSELARLEWIHVWRSLNSSRRSKTDTLQRRCDEILARVGS
ncbi:hypothetical protein FRC04_001565 [Tulasnella sp. 424]|nr:hypothetical protein FRC04_001565 [Tulasnella sp. 424]